MEANKINESKYQIRDILLAQKSEDKTRMLFERFHSELSIEFKKVEYSFHSRTHIRGVTYFANDKKAFLGLNIQQSYLSLLFFTGKYQVIGLQKGNWMRAGDNNGSKMFKVNDGTSIHEAVRAAILCYRIAAEWPSSLAGNLFGITKERI
jgi:hypothetical protein